MVESKGANAKGVFVESNTEDHVVGNLLFFMFHDSCLENLNFVIVRMSLQCWVC